MPYIKALDHRIQDAWQPAKLPEQPFPWRKVYKRKQLYGWLRLHPHGQIVYWAKRRVGESVYTKDAWAIDASTVAALAMFKVGFIGIEVEDGSRYLTQYENFKLKTAGGKADRWDYSKRIGMAPGAKGKLGADQRIVHMMHFKAVVAPPASTIKLMRV
jgi:hypothetical protein